MGSLITGALIILLSKIIASLFPTPSMVALANFFVPSLSNEKVTTV